MIRQIAFCVAGAFVISLGLGCGKGGTGVKIEKSLPPESSAKKAATYQGRVTQIIDMVGNPDEQMVTRRVRGANAAIKIAAEPNLPPEERAKLVDALKKAIAAEQDEEAKTLEKEALTAMEAGPPAK